MAEQGPPVLARPVEATAIGNVLVQTRAHGLISGSLDTLREVTARAFPPDTLRALRCLTHA